MKEYFMFMDLEYNPTNKKGTVRKNGIVHEQIKNEIIQMAIILTDDKFKILGKSNTYIKMFCSKDISEHVLKLISYDKQFLDCNGVSLHKALDKIYDILKVNKVMYKKDKVNIVTFSDADERVLKENMLDCTRELLFNHEYIDAQVLFANKFNFYTENNSIIRKSLLYCCDYVGVNQDEEYWHDAQYDTLLLHRLVKEMFKNNIREVKNYKEIRNKSEKYVLKGIS